MSVALRGGRGVASWRRASVLAAVAAAALAGAAPAARAEDPTLTLTGVRPTYLVGDVIEIEGVVTGGVPDHFHWYAKCPADGIYQPTGGSGAVWRRTATSALDGCQIMAVAHFDGGHDGGATSEPVALHVTEPPPTQEEPPPPAVGPVPSPSPVSPAPTPSPTPLPSQVAAPAPSAGTALATAAPPETTTATRTLGPAWWTPSRGWRRVGGTGRRAARPWRTARRGATLTALDVRARVVRLVAVTGRRQGRLRIRFAGRTRVVSLRRVGRPRQRTVDALVLPAARSGTLRITALGGGTVTIAGARVRQ